MSLTPQHAQYFAHGLTRLARSGMDRLSMALFDVAVDLNPHQIEAAHFAKQGYSSKDSEFDLIYVNGGNNLGNRKTPTDLWNVRLIEEDFHRLMFEMEGV